MRQVIGIDEAGRGALAGPIVAVAVRIRRPQAFPFRKMRDSKLLSDEQRRNLATIILYTCEVAYGVASNRLIDRIGIQAANVLAVEHALCGMYVDLPIHGDYIGGFQNYSCFPWNISFHVRGESQFPEIAAASIAAKVFRDDCMIKLHRELPGYGFDRHKGYGTTLHRGAIQRLGKSSAHRFSFAGKPSA